MLTLKGGGGYYEGASQGVLALAVVLELGPSPKSHALVSVPYSIWRPPPPPLLPYPHPPPTVSDACLGHSPLALPPPPV